MRITTHQPIFLPWPGFFYKASRADALVLLDEVQFPLGRSWMTRNRLKNDQGELGLTVPVWKKGRGKQVIGDVEICDDSDWRTTHLQSIRYAYAHAPYLDPHRSALETIYEHGHRRLVDFNRALIQYLWTALGMNGRLVLQSETGVSGGKSDLLVGLCRSLGADTYVTLPPVAKYLDPDQFRSNGVRLEFTDFSPPVYPQLWGDFRYNLSTLDLLLTCGLKTLEIITRAGARGRKEGVP